MTLKADRIDRPTEDPVSNVLKWVLLVVAVGSFAILGWTTDLTYKGTRVSRIQPTGKVH